MNVTNRRLRKVTRLINTVANYVALKNRDEKELEAAQNAVVSDYVERGLLLPCDVPKVERFFSPSRVPLGLKKKQLTIVVELLPLREWQKFHLPQGSSANKPPFDYDPDKPMSYQKFSHGIHQFLDQVRRELTVAKRFIFSRRKLDVIERLRELMGQKP